MRLWAERLGVRISDYSVKLANGDNPDLYLYCAPDFPFTASDGRDEPTARAALDAKLRTFLDETAWRRNKTVHIAGGGQDRVAVAVEAIERARDAKLQAIVKALS